MQSKDNLRKDNLAKGKIKSQLRKIAIPAALGFLFNTLFNVVDSFYAGQIGTDAIAGMTLSFPVFFLLIAIASGMGNGLNALAAIALGSKDKKRFHALFKNTVYISIAFGILIPIIAPFFARLLFQVQGAEEVPLDYGLSYITVVMIGYIFFMINFALNGMLYAQGNSKPFRNFLIIATIANIGLNPLFIFGFWFIPAMDTAGIGLATVLVQAGGSGYLFWHLLKSPNFEHKLFKKCEFSIKTIKDIFEQGIPSALNNATIAIGVFVINYYVMYYGGTSTVAAYGIAIRIEQLALVPTIGLNVAVLSIVGQSYGAKKKDRIYSTWKKGTIAGLVIMAIGVAVIVPLAPYLIALFDDTQKVVDAGTQYLRIEAFAFLSYVFLNIGVSVLQGIKKPMFAFWIGLFRQVLPFGLFYLLGTVLAMGILGVWWGIVIINWTAVAITLVYVSKMLKKKTEDFED
ncbi:MAG: MATE family efflux transporter [Candidatus Izemoplasmatales bacterium]